jgi:hypothetical protein
MQSIEIRVKGRIDEQWSHWFEDLTITHGEGDETILTGVVVDQARLYGVLTRLRDLGLALLSVNQKESDETV